MQKYLKDAIPALPTLDIKPIGQLEHQSPILIPEMRTLKFQTSSLYRIDLNGTASSTVYRSSVCVAAVYHLLYQKEEKSASSLPPDDINPSL